MIRPTRSVWVLLVAALADTVFGLQAKEDVLVGGKLKSGFDMGVDSSEQKRSWLKSEGEHFKMSYPADQSWGAVFITVGKPRNPPRPFRDLSAFNVLTMELKGGVGGESVGVGVKTNTQADDGSETKVPVKLTADWKVYEVSLDRFEGAELDKLYVVAEFVFSGSEAITVYVRNISYVKAQK